MTKDKVLEARGEVFEAALRFSRAAEAVAAAQAVLTKAKVEYDEAGLVLRSVRSNADALEASTVAEISKAERAKLEAAPVLDAAPARMPGALNESAGN